MKPSAQMTQYQLQDAFFEGYSAVLRRIDSDLKSAKKRFEIEEERARAIVTLLDVMAEAYDEAMKNLPNNSSLDELRETVEAAFNAYRDDVEACFEANSVRPTSKDVREALKRLQKSLARQHLMLGITKAWLRVKLMVVVWGDALELA